MDKVRLEYEMKKKGISTAELCKSLGISISAFYRKCNGKTEFKLCEIKKIARILELDSLIPIFFADEVASKETFGEEGA